MGSIPAQLNWIGKALGLSLSMIPLFVTQEAIAQPLSSLHHSIPPSPTYPLVHHLTPITPTDWEYQTLSTLIDATGLSLTDITGTAPNESLTRHEFAAAVNRAIAQLVNGVGSNGPYIRQRDYEMMARLATQFDLSIAVLGDRLTNQERRITTLESNRVSPTARLNGDAIIALNDRFGGDHSVQTTLQHRLRMNIAATFSGRDRLLTRLSAGDHPPLAHDSPTRATGEGTLAPTFGGNTEGQLILDALIYEFPVGDRISGYVSATGGMHSHYVASSVSPYFEDGFANGAISAFNQASPIYSIGGGAGLGMNATLDSAERVALSAGYLADDATLPSPGRGVFNSDYALLGQLTFTPNRQWQVGITYVHGFHSEGNAIFDFDGNDLAFIGTGFANQTHTQLETAATTHSVGIQASHRLNSTVTLNAFGGYTNVQFHDINSGDIWYYGVGLAFPNLLLPNSLAGLAVGVEPYLGGIDEASIDIPNATSLHIEAFYTFQLTDSMAFTPGFIWITAPNQQGDRPDYIVSTFRTTFRF